MTVLPPDASGPPGGPEPTDNRIEDGDWVHSVVSAALLQANIPDGQAQRVLAAATSQPEEHSSGDGPFSMPAKPQADDWPALEAERRVEATQARLAADRSSVDHYAANPAQPDALANAQPATSSDVPSPAATAVGTLPRPVGQSTSTSLPTLDDQPTSVHNVSIGDEVLAESDASVEGYRQSDVRTIVEWLLVVFLALVVAVLAKEFVVQAFWIPSESMETTVNVGDRVLVNKLSYQFNDVRRGDLVVFSKVEGTQSDTEDLIKRTVALPGETIELRADGRLWIWGPGETPNDALLLDEPYLDVQNALLNAPSPTDAPSASIWHENCVNDGSNLARCTLDDNSFFMMGDNRSSSLDSRGFGPVPEDNLIGRAFFRIWPLGAVSTL